MSNLVDTDVSRSRRIAYAFIHLAFVVVNLVELVGTARQRALTEAINWEKWGITIDQIDQILVVDAWGTFGRLFLAGVGFYLTALIVHGDRRVLRYYLGYGCALAGFEVALHASQLELWGLPHGTPWAAYVAFLVVYLGAWIGWLVYVLRSAQVRSTFVRLPRVIRSWERVAIALTALTLVVWPFLLNLSIDATDWVAWFIYPKDGTSARGIANGVLEVTTAGGLFILMRSVWRPRGLWIALLLPVFHAALRFAYGFQSFLLHWTF